MPTKTKSPRPRQKPVYHIRNWAEYDRALVARGSLTVWVSDDVVAAWGPPPGPRTRGGQVKFSDQAIEATLTLKAVFHLTNRAVEGFLGSLFDLMGLALAVPDHTTLSLRGRTVQIELPRYGDGPLDVVLDSTGLKVYGEGEWKVRQHGVSKRRTWRKLHLGIDPVTGEIQAAMLSEASVTDAEMVAPLLDQIERPIASTTGDGAYDQRQVYAALARAAPEADVRIPPRRGARIEQHGNCAAPPLPRDETLRAIRAQGRAAWKKESGYHQRSLAETAMFRLKTIFGPDLSARRLDTQATEAGVRCRALNIMTRLGMPDSVLIIVTRA